MFTNSYLELFTGGIRLSCLSGGVGKLLTQSTSLLTVIYPQSSRAVLAIYILNFIILKRFFKKQFFNIELLLLLIATLVETGCFDKSECLFLGLRSKIKNNSFGPVQTNSTFYCYPVGS